MLGRVVRSLDVKKKELILDRGVRVTYSKLLIATGGEPLVPPVKGLEGTGVACFTSWNDAVLLKKQVKRGAGVVIIGAGLIGIKAAEGLKALGAKVTIVEREARPLPAVLDERAGKIIARHVQKTGVRLLLGRRVVELLRNKGRLHAAVLDDGMRIPCSQVVIATGVRPRTGLCKGTGMTVRSGIVVNRHMMTSVREVYAAGDVTEAAYLSGGKRNIPVWPLAYAQGRVAGACMAGKPVSYKPGMQMNSIEVLGLPFISLGESWRDDGEAEIIAVWAKKGNAYRKLVLVNNTIVGALFVEEIERAGIIAGLMLDKVDVGMFKDELMKEKFGYIYVPKEYRAKYIAPLEV
jgi:NAD(P)H-nitrite reductase large subunit